MIVAVHLVAVPLKVLVVEDDATTLHGIKQLLERANYQVLTANSFDEGRFALSEGAPDLLLTDVRLGEYNGLQLVATSRRAVPSIIITGYNDPVLEAEARRLGAEFLIKPVVPSALLAMIKRMLERPTDAAQYEHTRRWLRKRVSSGLPASVDDAPARILDISYGGLRFEIDRQIDRALPASVRLDVPEPRISVPVGLVWASRVEDHWVCGGEVLEASGDTARAWQKLVDEIA
jgi:DNA-binding response OmpR family regulator